MQIHSVGLSSAMKSQSIRLHLLKYCHRLRPIQKIDASG
jgi:hypothetical protein